MSLSPKPKLRVDWATHEAAKFACLNWHYSRSFPAGKNVKVGVWEDGKFVGAVIFARGSNKEIGTPFRLQQTEAVELVRVAMTKHACQVSQVLAFALRFLRRNCPGIRLVVSFADQNQSHVGTIYQANGWLYAGFGSQDPRCRPYQKGSQVFHWRTVAGKLSEKGLPSTVAAAVSLGFVPLESKPKFKYLMPLDDEMRARILPLAKPYPKRVPSKDIVVPASPAGEGGENPTGALPYRLATE